MHRRPNSLETPPYFAEVSNLQAELEKIQENVSAKCEKNIEEMTSLVNKFEEDFKSLNDRYYDRVAVGASAASAGVALSAFTLGSSAALGAASALVVYGVLFALFAGFQKQYKESNMRSAIDKQLQDVQNQLQPLIELMEKIFHLTEKLLRNPQLPEHSVQKLKDLDVCLRAKLFKTHDQGEHTQSEISDTCSSLNEVLGVLKKIVKDKELVANKKASKIFETVTFRRKKDNKIDVKEFTIKATKFTGEMREGIDTLKGFIKAV